MSHECETQRHFLAPCNKGISQTLITYKIWISGSHCLKSFFRLTSVLSKCQDSAVHVNEWSQFEGQNNLTQQPWGRTKVKDGVKRAGKRKNSVRCRQQALLISDPDKIPAYASSSPHVKTLLVWSDGIIIISSSGLVSPFHSPRLSSLVSPEGTN